MKNKRRITGILAALLLAIIGTVALVGYVQSAKDKAVADEALVDVYVVDKLVPKGAEPETIKSSVSVEHVPTRLKQSGAITDLDAVGTNVAATDLQPGDQLLAARLVAKDEVSEEVTDKVQISTLLAAERAVGGSLQKGDLVGVYLSFDPFDLDDAEQYHDADDGPGECRDRHGCDDDHDVAAPKKSPNTTRLEFQHVLVTNVQTTDAPVNADDQRQRHRPSCRSPVRSTSSRSPCRPSSRSASCSPPSSATSGCPTSRPPSPTTAPGWSPSATSTRW